MSGADRSPRERGSERPCPLCGGSGDYHVAPVGHILCPGCEDGVASMRRPNGRPGRE